MRNTPARINRRGKLPVKGAAFGLALFLCLGLLWSLFADTNDHYVEWVFDGDTVRLENRESVRLIGINSPELSHDGHAAEPYAEQAKQALIHLVDQRGIRLVAGRRHRDRYGRLLAYVELPDGEDVQQQMLQQGLAFAIAVPPDTQRAEHYFKIEDEARKARRGIWSGQSGELRKLASSVNDSDNKRFRLIHGKVQRINESRTNIYLTLSAKLQVKISRKLWKATWPRLKPASLVDKNIEARGWINEYKKRLHVVIKYPAMLNLNAEYD